MSSLFEFNIDLAIEYVKNIYENILCAICDKPDLPRIRFSCGHSICENCFNASIGCYICLTPPSKFKYDAVLTQQVNNVSRLMNAFQEAFNVDVYKRKRLSEYLKIEKELFPHCIQAPLKYYNKGKSYRESKSYSGKENNPSKFFGEDISPVKVNRMENSVNYVQNWLNSNGNNRKRKPLGDINLDNVNIKRKSVSHNQKAALNIKSYEKKQRNIRKTTNPIMDSQNTLHSFLTDIKIKQDPKDIPMKRSTKFYEKVKTEISNRHERDESGIVIDDTPSLIEDSQLSVDYDKHLFNTTVDKDKNALLEVLKASKIEHDSVIENRTTSDTVEIEQINEIGMKNEFYQQYKVPFYKMSYLQENCYLCAKDVGIQNIAKYESRAPSKDICVTINNNSYTATIKVTNNIQNIQKVDKKISKFVQTDIVDINKSYNNCDKELEVDPLKDFSLLNKSVLVTTPVDVMSQELFMSENHEGVPDEIDENIINDHNIEFEKRKNIIIEESDSSEDMEESRVLEVTADIHRSCDQLDYDILSKIENIEEHKHRPRRRPRGHTPDSSNSSDKENYDPNRSKKLKTSKKGCCKK